MAQTPGRSRRGITADLNPSFLDRQPPRLADRAVNSQDGKQDMVIELQGLRRLDWKQARSPQPLQSGADHVS